MKDDFKYIDELVKTSFVGYKEEADSGVWENLRWTLFWMKYKWIIYLSSVALLVGVVSLTSYQLSKQSTYSNEFSSGVDPELSVVLAYNQVIENHAEYEDDATIQNFESTTQLDSYENRSMFIAQAMTSTEIISTDDLMEVDMANDQYSSNTKLWLSAIKPLAFTDDLTINPDTLLMGENRRTDLKYPGVKNHAISVSIYAGSLFSDAQLSGINSEYLVLRNDHESYAAGWSVGSDLKFHVKNWVFTTGINYSVYNQKRTYVNNFLEYSPEESHFQFDTTWVWVYDAPNYGVPVVSGIDSTWISVFNEKVIDHSGFNQVRYFEIPLLVGYSFKTNLFTIELNAGASMGFLSYSEFKVPGMNNYTELREVTDINETMINAVANATVYYHVSRRVSMFASPYYKQNLHSIFNDNVPQKQVFKTIGINFGVNILF